MKENESLNVVDRGTTETSVAPENVISQEDRERLDALFERIGDDYVGHTFADYREQMLVKKLHDEGVIAAKYLLEKLSKNGNDNEWFLFSTIHNLKICADVEIAPEIGALLVEDKIFNDTDGSNKSGIITILENIGTASEAHFISESVRKTLSREPYTDNDTQEAFRCLEKILERTVDPDSQSEVKIAMEDINSFRKNKGLEALPKPSLFSKISTKVNSVFSWQSFESDASSDKNPEADQFSDNDADDDFGEEYYREGKMLSATDRLEIVKNLRIAARREKGPDSDPDEPDNFLRKQFLEYREKNPSRYGVTMGIEIEIPTKTVIDEDFKKKHPKITDEYHDEYNRWYKKFKESERIGVPEGDDGNQFWEFAHEPAHNPLTISREVQALVGMGLINKNYTKYPLHCTLGGITSKGFCGNQTHLLSHALEATAWSTNTDRLTRPYCTKNGSWACKGKGSIQERNEEYKWGTNTEGMKSDPELGIGGRGVEHRSLQFQSLIGLDRHLHSAYYLGTALRSYQERAENNTENDTVLNELADIWGTFSLDCSKLFNLNGLKDPSEVWNAGLNHYSEEPSPFKYLAKILEEGTTDKESPAAKFIHDMRLLIIKTRTKIKEVLEKENKVPKE